MKNKNTGTDMVIRVPAHLAAKLRRLLKTLELPESCLHRLTREILANLLDSEDVLISGWAYTDRAQAERVARRLFAHPARTKRQTMIFGKEEQTITFLSSKSDAHDSDWWPKYVRDCLREEPDRHVVISTTEGAA